jgi:hypothetical protein
MGARTVRVAHSREFAAPSGKLAADSQLYDYNTHEVAEITTCFNLESIGRDAMTNSIISGSADIYLFDDEHNCMQCLPVPPRAIWGFMPDRTGCSPINEPLHRQT